jgi:hypothetical protein
MTNPQSYGRCAFFLAAALIALAALGCDNDVAARRTLTKKLAGATKEMADLLAAVKDKPTAEAARTKIQTLIEQVDTWTEQIDNMEESVGFGDEAILKAHGEWTSETTRLMKEQYRIGQIPEAREGLGDTWQQLTGGMYDPGGIFAPGGKMDMGGLANPPSP